MKTPHYTPIQQLKSDRSSIISQQPYHQQTQYNYQLPKIDHAFIIQNYRRLRIQQRQQLAKLKINQNLKIKIFNFKQDENLSYDKPNLTIFNHPFRGKMVLTRQEVQQKLAKQRLNAEQAKKNKLRGEPIPQNILNQMGLQGEQLQLRQFKMQRQQPESQINYPRKPRATFKQPQRKIAQQVNRQQQKIQQQNDMLFIHKPQTKGQTQKQKNIRNQKLMNQKQQKKSTQRQLYRKDSSPQDISKSKSKSKQKPKRKANAFYKDMPIIGQEPKVVRDIKFDSGRNLTPDKNSKKGNIQQEKEGKMYYRPFGNQNEIRQFNRKFPNNKNQINDQGRFGSGQGLIKKYKTNNNNDYKKQQQRSISEISAIQSNEKDDDLSNSQSLNKALFMQ